VLYPPVPLTAVRGSGEPSGVEDISGSLFGSVDVVEGAAGGVFVVGGLFLALSVAAGSVGSAEPGQNIFTATTPSTRLTTAPAAISAWRFVGFSPVNDASPLMSFGTPPPGAGFAAGGAGGWPDFASTFAAVSGLPAAAAAFGPGIDGSFTGVSTAIGSIRRPPVE
jgi:hypothetical protein